VDRNDFLGWGGLILGVFFSFAAFWQVMGLVHRIVFRTVDDKNRK
jgi:hypothetical protein